MFHFKKGTQLLALTLSIVAFISVIYIAATENHTWRDALTVTQFPNHQPAVNNVISSPAPSSCAPAPISTLVVNVKDKGAKGNAIDNDTMAIQSAIDQVAKAGGGTVFVPDGTYMVDAVKRIYLKSNITFSMSKDAVLKAIPNNSDKYDILRIQSASNVNVIGGTVLGERNQHLAPAVKESQYGYGVSIVSSQHVVIEGVTARDLWGDGFYVGGGTPTTPSIDVKFCSVIADNVRRNGISITSVNEAVVQDSIFQNTNGANPQAGIDLEPNAGETVQNVQVVRSQFLDNAHAGIEFYGNAINSKILNVTIDHNTLVGNTAGLAVQYTHGHRITNNTITDKWTGISLLGGSTKNIITGNTINVIGHGPSRDIINDSGGNSISDNTFIR